jgi:bla regulator protein blaR1
MPRDLPSLASSLSRLVGADRPVIDQTGLTGSFALDLDMSRITDVLRDAEGPSGPSEMILESAGKAIQLQLGLKLAPAKALLEILVVDRAEKPSEN